MIADDAITASHIGAGVVGASEIATDAVAAASMVRACARACARLITRASPIFGRRSRPVAVR